MFLSYTNLYTKAPCTHHYWITIFSSRCELTRPCLCVFPLHNPFWHSWWTSDPATQSQSTRPNSSITVLLRTGVPTITISVEKHFTVHISSHKTQDQSAQAPKSMAYDNPFMTMKQKQKKAWHNPRSNIYLMHVPWRQAQHIWPGKSATIPVSKHANSPTWSSQLKSISDVPLWNGVSS